jgi:hypothetical protein
LQVEPVLLHLLHVNLPAIPLALPPLQAAQSCTGRKHFLQFAMISCAFSKNAVGPRLLQGNLWALVTLFWVLTGLIDKLANRRTLDAHWVLTSACQPSQLLIASPQSTDDFIGLLAT